MKNRILLFFLMPASSAIIAQTRLVTGFVRNHATNSLIQFATVKVKGKNTVVETGVRGSLFCKVCQPLSKPACFVC